MKSSIDSDLNILNEIAQICDHVTLTGALREGREAVVRRYNQTLAHLNEAGASGADQFHPLPADASFDTVGVEARLLRAAVSPRGKRHDSEFDIETIQALAPFARGEDIAKMIHKYVDTGRPVPVHMLAGLAPFLRSEDLTLLMERAMNPPAPPVPPTAPSAHLERVAHPVEVVDDASLVRDTSLTPEQRLAAAERLIRLHGDLLD